MHGHEWEGLTVDETLRLLRALTVHRYVAGRSHFIHALAFASLSPPAGDAEATLGAAQAWARATLGDPSIDAASRDPALLRRSSDAELLAVVSGFWTDAGARERLAGRLTELGIEVDGARLPFDDTREEDVYPVLVDGGFELFRLAELDPVRHRGAIESFGEEITWLSARFEEENAVPAPEPYLQELPVFGPEELLYAFDDDGRLRAPFVVWTQGEPRYHDYVLRGVERGAKLG